MCEKYNLSSRLGYQALRTPITLQIPMNLNFRSLLLFTEPVSCFDSDNFRCPRQELCANCSSFCIPLLTKCDGLDSCSEDESNCVISQPRSPPHSSYRYGREALSSSQIMLIGFFALNGSFIVFFLILSLCSAGIWFAKCPIYKKKSKASRHTFIRYLREAIPSQHQHQSPDESEPLKTIDPTTLPSARKKTSILNRINFQPAPALKELEPEFEDREIEEQSESICSPPAHQPEVFLRRQSLPFGIVPPNNKPRLGIRAMSVQH
ncbi:unnamed protein product [Caenorhabditis angaria]|uniref:Uncharacterized protein n=1 Tax=Caenorhabditis angaria TaxID=860376 RepID=A0A9P1IV17_9PELO|nr:unnamed protein product [Caenorhabditis angaria]